MRPENYEFMIKFLKERSGLVLSADKTYLVENRLMSIVRHRMLADLDELVGVLQKGDDRALIKEVTEAMTTNESFFFRDLTPFKQFRETVLPQFIESRSARKKLRIWCAAASTGQEPYTLAMILNEEAAALEGWRLEIVGTDLSSQALGRARAGLYTQFEVQRGLPVQYLMKYFQQKDNQWEIDQAIRSMVTYKEFNLLDDLSPIGPCDIVFCRNVLIYFDQQTKGRILEGISKLLPADGFLYLGGAETVLGVSDKFKTVPGLSGVYGVVGQGATGFAPRPTAAAANDAKKVLAG